MSYCQEFFLFLETWFSVGQSFSCIEGNAVWFVYDNTSATNSSMQMIKKMCVCVSWVGGVELWSHLWSSTHWQSKKKKKPPELNWMTHLGQWVTMKEVSISLFKKDFPLQIIKMVNSIYTPPLHPHRLPTQLQSEGPAKPEGWWGLRLRGESVGITVTQHRKYRPWLGRVRGQYWTEWDWELWLAEGAASLLSQGAKKKNNSERM